VLAVEPPGSARIVTLEVGLIAYLAHFGRTSSVLDGLDRPQNMQVSIGRLFATSRTTLLPAAPRGGAGTKQPLKSLPKPPRLPAETARRVRGFRQAATNPGGAACDRAGRFRRPSTSGLACARGADHQFSIWM
jgi:hypothetical protein